MHSGFKNRLRFNAGIIDRIGIIFRLDAYGAMRTALNAILADDIEEVGCIHVHARQIRGNRKLQLLSR